MIPIHWYWISDDAISDYSAKLLETHFTSLTLWLICLHLFSNDPFSFLEYIDDFVWNLYRLSWLVHYFVEPFANFFKHWYSSNRFFISASARSICFENRMASWMKNNEHILESWINLNLKSYRWKLLAKVPKKRYLP